MLARANEEFVFLPLRMGGNIVLPREQQKEPTTMEVVQVINPIIKIILPGYFFDAGCFFRLIPLDCLRIIITKMNSMPSRKYTCCTCTQSYSANDLTSLSLSRIRNAELNMITEINIECKYCQISKGKRRK